MEINYADLMRSAEAQARVTGSVRATYSVEYRGSDGILRTYSATWDRSAVSQ